MKNCVTGIDHIGIRVSDLTTARHFYEQLGFEFIIGPVGPEPVAVLEHPCGIVINFILNAHEKPEANVLMDVPQKHAGFTHIALTVNDLVNVKTLLDELGVEITEGPINFGENFGSSLFIRDQDKNVIEFHQVA